jgi:hypothetical protein
LEEEPQLEEDEEQRELLLCHWRRSIGTLYHACHRCTLDPTPKSPLKKEEEEEEE